MLLFYISSYLVERCSKRVGTRTVKFFNILGSLCRLNHYTIRWEVVLWVSHWFIYSADSFRNDTTVWCSEFSVANIATFFQKSTPWSEKPYLVSETHLYCLTSMFYNPNYILYIYIYYNVNIVNHTTSIVFIWFVWWFGQIYRIII